MPRHQIEEISHLFGITKPPALVWGMQSPGHHYNGYCCSILGTALKVMTGNFEAPGGAIDTELVKSDKGGSATGKQFKNKKVKRTVNGKEVEGTVENLHMDYFGSKYPAAWDDVVASSPGRLQVFGDELHVSRVDDRVTVLGSPAAVVGRGVRWESEWFELDRTRRYGSPDSCQDAAPAELR